jgi:GNAT superfamily N-acetyltransferase
VARTVRPFAPRDLNAAAEVLFVVAAEHGGRGGRVPAFEVPADARRTIERLLELDPIGGQLAEDDGRIVALGWAHPRGRVATIGPVAVLPQRRGRGLGRLVLDACLAGVGERGVQVRMLEDAADAPAVGLALRAGFRVVTAVLEMERPPGFAIEPTDFGPGVAVRIAIQADDGELVARDARAWGAPRPTDIAVRLAHGTGAILERRDRVVAHALAVHDERAAWLGPAAGDEAAVVASLLGHLAAEHARRDQLPARALVPAGDQRLVDALLALGFRVRATFSYLARGGGTAPPAGSVLCSRVQS